MKNVPKDESGVAEDFLPNCIKRGWVNCPICGESDMRREEDRDGNAVILCVNHACASNGGSNSDALPKSRTRQSTLDLQAINRIVADQTRSVREQLTEMAVELEECKHQNGISDREMVLERERDAARATADNLCWQLGKCQGIASGILKSTEFAPEGMEPPYKPIHGLIAVSALATQRNDAQAKLTALTDLAKRALSALECADSYFIARKTKNVEMQITTDLRSFLSQP